jgi:hypothetical protein
MPDRRRLAGAVVAEEAERATARNCERHVVHREAFAEALGQLIGLDDVGS